jgi:PIN domain nuclease of toxin-antitoxin system
VIEPRAAVKQRLRARAEASRRDGVVERLLADCCCLALGIRLNLPVVGGAQAWEALRIGVDVDPLR